MFEPPPKPRAPIARTIASVVAHAAVIWAIVGHHQSPIRVTLPGTHHGNHIDLTYLPGQSTPPAPMQKAQKKSQIAAIRPLPAVKSAIPAPVPPAPTPSNVTPAASSAQSGTDARGDGDIHIALTAYSPDPEPDLSALPRGTQGDVIVDVTIDPTGRVADLQILRALGFGIEDNVVRTVRTWVFHPATRDGTPIASVQELHFHFARS